LSEWEPATEAEAALREALAAADQEQYFRILARMELLLPVAAEALAGRVPMGWGTWTTANRTHVLAFTSPASLQACLNDRTGTYRVVPFHRLGTEWPNYEWWLAVNPGLPIESYLPSWFVAQLVRGDVRLPGRAPTARARMAQSDLAAALNGRVRASAPAPTVTTQPIAQAASAGVRHGVETVEAEIIDYPPPAGAARVYTAGVAYGPEPAAATYAATFTSRPVPPPQPEPAPAPAPKAREAHDAEVVTPPVWAEGFAPANETEINLLSAVEANNTDSFLSTLLLARIILPVPVGTPSTARPRDRDFPWQIEDRDGQRFISVFTSPERLGEHLGWQRSDPATVSLRFVQLIAAWPNSEISFAINPGSPVGATLPGSQIVALAAWAREVGLREEPAAEMVVAAKRTESAPSLGVAGAPVVGAERATVMQRTIPHTQVAFYLERGYDRVSGFVNRASEVAHLTTPRLLYRALGLSYSGSTFSEDDADVHVLRWVAHRADLYRLPYGGQHEAAMRAMQGWVVERAPFRGNGFAPGDTDVVAEFKVDSVRLPHGARIVRLDKEGTETLVATFDADAVRWVAPHA
jgi:hypothetical protein